MMEAALGREMSKAIILPNALLHRNLYAFVMKLFAPPHHQALLMVTAYDDDQVTINGQPQYRSLLLLPDSLDQTWGPPSFATLADIHLAPLAHLNCDVLLLGTGRKQRFFAPQLLRPLIEAGRGIELMNTQAACRTYNILVAEGRRVAAALIIESASSPSPG
jgi:uncharacterized protein